MTTENSQRFDFLSPEVPPDMPHFEIPLIPATPENFAPYGTIVTDYKKHHVPITQWLHTGWRPVDPGTGDEGGYMDGIFELWWEGDAFFGENKAVNDKYVLGWSVNPEQARTENPNPDHSKLLIWHANHHPDGGQLFYPLDNGPFIAALACTGDDMKPEDWVAFYCDGSFGVCLNAGIWHEAITPLGSKAQFYDKQGTVHARVGANFPKEFGILLSIPLNLEKLQDG